MHLRYTYTNKKDIIISSKSRSMKLKEGTALLIEVLDEGIKAKFRYRNEMNHICECGHHFREHDLESLFYGFNCRCWTCDCKQYKEVRKKK